MKRFFLFIPHSLPQIQGVKYWEYFTLTFSPVPDKLFAGKLPMSDITQKKLGVKIGVPLINISAKLARARTNLNSLVKFDCLLNL